MTTETQRLKVSVPAGPTFWPSGWTTNYIAVGSPTLPGPGGAPGGPDPAFTLR